MPDFGNPFEGNNSDKLLTDNELLRALRFSLAAEYEAIQLYTQLADSIANKPVAELLRDIADEEVVHAGEFLRAIKTIRPEEAELYQEGETEAAEIFKEKVGYLSKELDYIADSIENQDPRIALAIDQINDQLQSKTAVLYDKAMDAIKKQLDKKLHEKGVKTAYNEENTLLMSLDVFESDDLADIMTDATQPLLSKSTEAPMDINKAKTGWQSVIKKVKTQKVKTPNQVKKIICDEFPILCQRAEEYKSQQTSRSIEGIKRELPEITEKAKKLPKPVKEENVRKLFEEHMGMKNTEQLSTDLGKYIDETVKSIVRQTK